MLEFYVDIFFQIGEEGRVVGAESCLDAVELSEKTFFFFFGKIFPNKFLFQILILLVKSLRARMASSECEFQESWMILGNKRSLNQMVSSLKGRFACRRLEGEELIKIGWWLEEVFGR